MYTVSLIRAESYELKQLRSRLEYLLEPLGGIESIVKQWRSRFIEAEPANWQSSY